MKFHLAILLQVQAEWLLLQVQQLKTEVSRKTFYKVNLYYKLTVTK